MPIKVACNQCGNQFSAWEDLIGQSVGCPKCQALVTVLDPTQPPPPPDQHPQDRHPQDRQPQDRQPQDQHPQDRQHADDDDVEEFRLSPVAERPPEYFSDPLQPELAGGPSQPTAPDQPTETADERPTHCPNCSAELPRDGMLCNECNYHLLLQRVLDTTIDSHEPDNSTGFARWLNNQLAEGETPTSVKYWAIGVGLFFFCIFAFCMGAWVLVPALLVGGAVGVYYFVNRSSGGDASAKVEAGAKSLGLSFLRVVSWRAPEWPFPKLKAYSAKGGDFNDDDVAKMENTGVIEVLDFEGCPITDAALVNLEDWKQLRYLVLTKTQVTDEGVKRLAQALKETWIWT